jgi:hypothetical protein
VTNDGEHLSKSLNEAIRLRSPVVECYVLGRIETNLLGDNSRSTAMRQPTPSAPRSLSIWRKAPPATEAGWVPVIDGLGVTGRPEARCRLE